MNDGKKKAITLLKTSRGQIDGIIRMIEDGRYCVDISNQMLAAKGLLEKANISILEQHIKNCVKDAIVKGEGDQKIDEILAILDKYFR